MKVVAGIVLTAAVVWGQAPPSWKTLSDRAKERWTAEDFSGSEALCREAIQSAEKELGPNHPQLVHLTAQLGGVLHLEGRDAEAEPVVRRGLEIAKTSGDSGLMGIALNALGLALEGEGQVARAEPVLRRSLQLLKESEGEDSLDTAKVGNNLAVVYSNQGQYAQGEEAMTQAMSVYEKKLEPWDPLLAMAMKNMFVILFMEQKAEEAEPYLRRAIAIGETMFPGSAKMASLRFAQASLEASRGNFKGAAGLLKDVIATQERTLGPGHPELTNSLLEYATVLRHLHKKAAAKVAQHRASLMQKSFVADAK